MSQENQTFSSNFILLGIFGHSPTYNFLFSLVLGIFSVAFVGNVAMVLLMCLHTQLHTPMYFLLSQLSLMDLMLTCTIAPKTAFNYLSGSKSIPVALLGAECFLLAVMVYDRYVAICHPLRYSVLMSQKTCCLMAASSWILGSTDGMIDIAVLLSFSHCDAREVSNIFCDVPALLIFSCTRTLLFERIMLLYCIVMLLLPVAVIIAPYVRVILAVIRMGSAEGHRKAFSTCSSHLMVVGMYYRADMFIYMRPISGHSPTQDKMVPAFYTILTSMLNPLIYSLRNKEVARIFMKVLRKDKSVE